VADAPRITAANAPSASLPLRFIIAGLLALGIAGAWLVVNPSLITEYHYGPQPVAFTHLVLLGFGLSVVMGVLYQLGPVALDVKLYSERLARFQSWLHLIGVPGMVCMFLKWDFKQIGHFGSVFGIGVILFVYNMARTLARIPRWTPIAFGIATGIGWMLVTMSAGLFIACAKCWPSLSSFAPLPQMHAHAHLGLLGIFITLIVAVSYRLVPMFAVSKVQSSRRAAWSIALLNLGVASVATTILFQSPWKIGAALITISGLALFNVELRAILRAGARPKLDWGMRHFITGMSLITPTATLSLALCLPGVPVSPHLENVYAVFGLFGVLLFALIGILYKILPFFVWFHRYGSEIGRSKVPQLADMYSAPLQAFGYALHIAALFLVAGAAAFGSRPLSSFGCALFASSLLTLGINVVSILRHLSRRRPLEPLTTLRPAVSAL
jgi:hypothetical protein